MGKKRDQYYEQILDAIDNADIAPEDKELLEELRTALDRDPKKGTTTAAKFLKYVLTIARHREPPTRYGSETHGLSLRELLESEDAIETFRDWIGDRRNSRSGSSKPLSDNTKRHYYSAVRAMGKLLTDGDDRPPHIEALPASLGSRTDPTPHPNTILYWDDHVVPILDAPDVNAREKALAATAWESGARPWELGDLLRGDLEFRDDYVVLTIEDGKTTNRNIRLVAALPYLKIWLQEHPINSDLEGDEPIPPKTPLWTRLDQPTTLNDVGQPIRRVGNRVGIGRPTNLKQFRKSRASILAMSPEVTEQALRHRFGWTPKSDAPAHYKARFGTESEDQIARADGIDIELADEHEDPAPVRCPNCENWTPRHRRECLFCTAEFDPDAAEDNTAAELVEEQELREKTRELLAMVGEEELDPETLRRVEPFADVLDEDPDMTDKAEQFLESLDEA